MRIRAASFDEAKQFIGQEHRHHKPPRGHKFSLALEVDGQLVGVCTVGRPTGRGWDHKTVVEVTRLCTDGTANACSKLYSAARRAAQALGYQKLITYILASENGASLRAANWVESHTTKGGSWSCPSRPRQDNAPTEPKICFLAP